MKALILAAGLGTRLRPLTDTVPKILVPIDGKPLLSYHLEWLKKNGVTEVLINTHWLSDKVKTFCNNITKKDIKVTVKHEDQLIGGAGTLLANKDFFKDEEDFLVIYGDVLNNIKYPELIKYHKENGGVATIVCHELQNVHEKGMVVINTEGKITAFKEKPAKKDIVSNYVNGGIYVLNKEIFKHIRHFLDKNEPIDFGKDIFPFLLEKQIPIFAYRLKDFLMDIGNWENYNFINKEIHKIKF